MDAQVARWKEYHAQCLYLAEMWKLPINRTFISDDKWKGEVTGPFAALDSQTRDSIKRLVYLFKSHVQDYREITKDVVDKSFQKKLSNANFWAMNATLKNISKHLQAQPVKCHHEAVARISKDKDNPHTVRFYVPKSWHLTAYRLQKILSDKDQERYIFESSKSVGLTSDGNPIFNVSMIKVEYKPRSVGFQVLSRGKAFFTYSETPKFCASDATFTYSETPKCYAWDTTFIGARDQLRKVLAKEVSASLGEW